VAQPPAAATAEQSATGNTNAGEGLLSFFYYYFTDYKPFMKLLTLLLSFAFSVHHENFCDCRF